MLTMLTNTILHVYFKLVCIKFYLYMMITNLQFQSKYIYFINMHEGRKHGALCMPGASRWDPVTVKCDSVTWNVQIMRDECQRTGDRLCVFHILCQTYCIITAFQRHKKGVCVGQPVLFELKYSECLFTPKWTGMEKLEVNYRVGKNRST